VFGFGPATRSYVAAPSQCVCACCGGETTVIDYEISEVLEVKPAEHVVELTKREKRVCKKYEEQGLVAAPSLDCDKRPRTQALVAPQGFSGNWIQCTVPRLLSVLPQDSNEPSPNPTN
jgi:zinc-finger binding domain of transposase IS66